MVCSTLTFLQIDTQFITGSTHPALAIEGGTRKLPNHQATAAP
ncbi:hypothetical protein M2158_005940 [Streptomyces sp. SAI-144]|nr:hypothetical protein [Streptomyces sp. SAI-144]